MKIFSSQGQVYGNVNLTKLLGTANSVERVWQFPFDWVGQKLEDFDYAVHILSELENNKITDQTKKKIFSDFLVRKYFPEGFNYEKESRVIQDETEIKRIEELLFERAREFQIRFKDLTHKEIKRRQREQAELKEKLEEAKQRAQKENGITFVKQHSEQIDESSLGIIEIREHIDQINQRQEKNKKEIDEITKFKKIKQDNKNTKQTSYYQLPSEFYFPTTQLPPSKNAQKNYTVELSQQIQQIDSVYLPQNLSKRVEQLQVKTNLEKSPKKGLYDSSFTPYAQSSKRLISFSKFPQKNITPALQNKIQQDRAQTSQTKQMRMPFLTITPSRFEKNQMFVANLAKYGLNSKHNRPVQWTQAEELKDVKFHLGEGQRALKIATMKQEEVFESQSPNIVCKDNAILQKQQKYYKELKGKLCSIFKAKPEYESKSKSAYSFTRKQQVNKLLNQMFKQSKSQQDEDDNFQILAPKSFLKNPLQNQHKILKCKNKLIVLQK